MAAVIWRWAPKGSNSENWATLARGVAMLESDGALMKSDASASSVLAAPEDAALARISSALVAPA